MSYVYIHSEKSHYEEGRYYPGLWTVGFYLPDGKWEPESDWSNPKEAARRVHYLNGGNQEDWSEDFHDCNIYPGGL